MNWEDYGKYATDVFTEEAVKTIKTHDPSTHPLFLYLGHLAVHSANSYSPLQAPKEIVDKFSYIENKNRRKFAGRLCQNTLFFIAQKFKLSDFIVYILIYVKIIIGMLHKLDESVGKVVSILKEKNMLKDSVILFTTDNGGPAAGFNLNAASNWPLKGVKSNSNSIETFL